MRTTRDRPETPQQTTPPCHNVVLYDGLCIFCQGGAAKLKRLASPGAIELVDFQQAGVLDRFPGITHDACMRQMYLVTAEGRVYAGFEAAVQAVMTRTVLKPFAYLYYLPGLRQLCDACYRFIARRRYRLMGKAAVSGACAGGTCSIHARQAGGL